jgi:hypothetical protein
MIRSALCVMAILTASDSPATACFNCVVGVVLLQEPVDSPVQMAGLLEIQTSQDTSTYTPVPISNASHAHGLFE